MPAVDEKPISLTSTAINVGAAMADLNELRRCHSGRAYLATRGDEGRKRNPERRTREHSLCIEDRDFVHLALGQAELGGGGVVESDTPSRRRVYAAKIDRQLAVQEDPYVVIADEGQALAALVLEPVAHHAGK